ncbi:18977_t:CDS:2, partial [Gigaspora margarita]
MKKTTTKTQDVPLEVVNKCKGCVLNMLKDSQSCIENESVDNPELRLEKLETIEEFEI